MPDVTVTIIPMGLAEPLQLGIISDSLHTVLSPLFPSSSRLVVRSGRPLDLPEAAYNGRRSMYAADALIDALSGAEKTGGKLLGITSGDLYQGTWGHVIGAAHIGKAVAVLSTARLFLPPYTPRQARLFMDRVVKEAAHETAHLFGYAHCHDPACIMHISGSMRETDQKRIALCPECSRRRPVG